MKNLELGDFFPDVQASDRCVVSRIEGRLINCVSNDYLGLSSERRVVEAARQSLSDWGGGLVGSPALCGLSKPVTKLSSQLCEVTGLDTAIVFPSGYQACVGAIQSLGAMSHTFLCDRSIHASVIDGLRSSGKRAKYFTHNSVTDLMLKYEQLSLREKEVGVAVVCESVYSVHGERAPLEAISRFCKSKMCTLVVDESHAFGWYSGGLVSCLPKECLPDKVVVVFAFSKALGWVGGAVCTNRSLYLNMLAGSRSLLFSAAFQPHSATAVRKSIELAQTEPWRQHNAMAVTKSLSEMSPSNRVHSNGAIPVSFIECESASDQEAVYRELKSAGVIASQIGYPVVEQRSFFIRMAFGPFHNEPSVLDCLGDALNRI